MKHSITSQRWRTSASRAATMLPTITTDTMVKVRSSWVSSISGPGRRPMMTNTTSSTAIALLPGMPKATVGMIAPGLWDAVPVSGAMTPRTLPLPKLSGFLSDATAMAYDIHSATAPPRPGMKPVTTPTTLHLTTSHQFLAQSTKPTHNPETLRPTCDEAMVVFRIARSTTSGTANRPNTIGMSGIPSHK